MNKPAQKSKIARRRQLALRSGEQDYKERRAQLLQAAGRIFREKGYEKASIGDFAKAVGIDRASIYYYISSKEELFREMVHEAVRDNVLMVEQIRESAATPEEKVRALIVGIMRSYEKHYPYLYAYVQEDMARIAGDKTPWGKEMKLFSERFVVATVGIIQQGIDDGSFRLKSLSAQMIAFAVIGMCNWSHRWFRPSGRISLDMVGQSFAELALKGIIAGS
jgi:TetR/AcrR family transcriptional regulator, cholesterol catabolism regulator